MRLLIKHLVIRQFIASICICVGAFYANVYAKTVADEIRYEATLPNNGHMGRPLPLLAGWNSGERPHGFSPVFQMHKIHEGHHLLPWFFLPGPNDHRISEKYYRAAIKRAAELKLPIAFVGTQWEHLLTSDPAYFKLPPEQNPNIVTTDGRILRALSPFGPTSLWQEVGKKWTSTPILKKLQEWYPDPPLILFISNNEHPKLKTLEVKQSRRYVDTYGQLMTDDFIRKVIGEGWIKHYRALQNGMRDGLRQSQWKEKAIFIGYNAFKSPQFGRGYGWKRSSLYIPGRMQPWPLAWDGASVSYYVRPYNQSTDYGLWSPQIESMNWVFMLKEAYRDNPNFWFEISTWDGDEEQRNFYERNGQLYGPERYGGMVQFGMWLLRPRVVREFRMWNDNVDRAGPYFLKIAELVDRLYTNDTLKKFWRHGKLVPNRDRKHPYNSNIPREYKNVDRWFLLNTSLDPKWPWGFDDKIPVFSLALVMGEYPVREWLVYAHAPLQRHGDVQLEVPGYGPIKVAVESSGSYYHIIEKTKSVSTIVFKGANDR